MSQALGWHLVTQLGLAVFVVNKHQLGLMPCHLVVVHLGKGRDDDQVAGSGAACDRAVDRNHAGAAFTLDGVGDKTLAVVDVPDVDLLVLGDVGRVEQVFIDGAGAFIVQFAVGYCGTADLGLDLNRVRNMVGRLC